MAGSAPSHAARSPSLPPIVVEQCIDDTRLRTKVAARLESGLTWPDDLAYQVETRDAGQTWVLLEYDGELRETPLGNFSGDCRAIEDMVALTIVSELRSRAQPIEPPRSDEPLEHESPENRERIISPPEPENPDPERPGSDSQPTDKTLATNSVPAAEPFFIHPALGVSAGYGAVPTHAMRHDGHAIEVLPRFELLRPGSFSVSLALRNFVSLRYGTQATALFGELSVCRLGRLSHLDLGVCGSVGYGGVDMPTASGTQHVRASQLLMALSGRMDVWVATSVALQVIAGITGHGPQRIDNASLVYPHVTMGIAYVFGCTSDMDRCRPPR